MSALNAAVHELTRDHMVVTNRDPYETATEYALLTQLEDAKHRGLHTGGASSGGGKLPFGTGPHDLEAAIIRTIHQTASPHHRHDLAKLPLPARVQHWANTVEQTLALDWVTYWSELIRDLYRTKFFVEGKCPACQAAEYLEDKDGQVTAKDTIMVTVETQVAGCLNCGATWEGVENMARLNAYM